MTAFQRLKIWYAYPKNDKDTLFNTESVPKDWSVGYCISLEIYIPPRSLAMSTDIDAIQAFVELHLNRCAEVVYTYYDLDSMLQAYI